MNNPITVYVAKESSFKTILKEGHSLLSYIQGMGSRDGDIYTIGEQFEFKNNTLFSVGVLEPATAYVHTPEELLELRKKWANEDFNAGMRYGNFPISSPDKSTYINNLTIE
jgi:hypothetical protein